MRPRPEKPAAVKLEHGANCQCLACRVRRFAERGAAAQSAVDNAVKEATMAKGKAKKPERTKAKRARSARRKQGRKAAGQRRARHVEVIRGMDQQFYVRTVAANGQITAGSEGYVRKEDAMHEAQARGLEIRDLTTQEDAAAQKSRQ